MRVIVAKSQVRSREARDERSGRQTRDLRNTNRQRGRVRAASVPLNAKPEAHQDAPCRAGRRAVKVQVLTRGDLHGGSRGEVSRGRSSEENRRKPGGAKGRSTNEHGSTRSDRAGRETLGTTRRNPRGGFRGPAWSGGPVKPEEAAKGGVESSAMSEGERKP